MRARGSLSDATAGALWLLAVGGSLGLALGTRLFAASGADFLLYNRISATGRAGLLVSLALGALAATAPALLGWLAGRGSAERVHATGARLAPLLPLALASLLLDPLAFAQAKLVHLVGCAALVFLARTCWQVRALAPPLAIETVCLRRLAALPTAARLRSLAARPALPWLLVGTGAALYGAWFSAVTLAAHWNGYTRSYDLAIFDNLMWNLLHGGEFLVSTPAGGGEHSHFGRHATLVAYVLAPLYALHPSAATLLVIQAFGLGLGALPLFAFARIHLGPALALGLAFAYLLYPPLHGSNLYDFHFLSLSPTLVFCLAHALETRSRAWLAAATALTLLCREDVAIAVALLGAFHVLTNRRVRAGVVLVALGSLWFATMKFVLMPLAAPGASYAEIYQGLLPDGSLGFGGVLQTLLSNPAFVLASLLTQTKLEYALLVFAPLAFVPLRQPIGALFALPGLLFTLLSTGYPPTLSIGYQYTAFWTPYLFVASVWLLRRDAFFRPETAEARASRHGWLAALALGTLVCSVQYGAVFQQSTATGGIYEVFPFGTTEHDLRRRALRDEVLRALPPDATVVASESVAPHVSNRAVAYTLREGVRDAEYVVFGVLPEAPGEHLLIRPLLASGRYGVVALNASYALLRRGAPTRLNGRLLPLLRFPAAASETP